MIDAVAQALARLNGRELFTGPDDLVFAGIAGNHLDDSALRRRYKRVRDRAGLRPLRFHDLRHTFGTHAIRTADPRELQEWMGHADFATTQIYLSTSRVPRRRSGSRRRSTRSRRSSPRSSGTTVLTGCSGSAATRSRSPHAPEQADAATPSSKRRMSGAKYDEQTRWPPDFHPDVAGAVRTCLQAPRAMGRGWPDHRGLEVARGAKEGSETSSERWSE
jgi:hypothetical protein